MFIQTESSIGRRMNHFLETFVVTLIVFFTVFSQNALGATKRIVFEEDFESGYDGWKRTDGFVIFPRTQKIVACDGDFAFRMTAVGCRGFSGRFKHALDIPVTENTTFQFGYYFLRKQVSYVGYQVEYSDKKEGNYFSLFFGSFVNISAVYVVQYESETIRTWHSHEVDLYKDYMNAFGTVPSGLRITSVSLMIGDPYFTKKLQTAYFDSIRITQEGEIRTEIF
jgi:hypothetical protein